MQVTRFVFLVSIVLAMAAGGWAADKANEEKTGLQVGTKAPAFTLKNQNGKVRTLEEFLKNGKVALVFYRNNEAEPLRLWIDPAEGWQVAEQLVLYC